MICVDASFVLALLLPDEEFSQQSHGMFTEWRMKREEVIAPALMSFEVISGIRRAVFTSRITPERGDITFVLFERMPIAIREPADLFTRTWDLGKQLQPQRLY